MRSVECRNTKQQKENNTMPLATAPLDLAPVATEIVGYVGTAGVAGLVIFGAIYGLRIMIKAFRTVAK
jgi:hypothetical protein